MFDELLKTILEHVSLKIKIYSNPLNENILLKIEGISSPVRIRFIVYNTILIRWLLKIRVYTSQDTILFWICDTKTDCWLAVTRCYTHTRWSNVCAHRNKSVLDSLSVLVQQLTFQTNTFNGHIGGCLHYTIDE